MAAEEGGYVLLSIGSSPVTDSAGTSSGLGIEGGLGYNVSRYLGVEAVAGGFGVSALARYNIVSLSISAVGHIPIHNGLGIYVKAGEGESFLTVSGTGGGRSQEYSGSGGLYGAGIEFTADKQSFRIGLDHYDLSAGGISLSTNYVNLTGTVQF